MSNSLLSLFHFSFSQLLIIIFAELVLKVSKVAPKRKAEEEPEDDSERDDADSQDTEGDENDSKTPKRKVRGHIFCNYHFNKIGIIIIIFTEAQAHRQQLQGEAQGGAAGRAGQDKEGGERSEGGGG